MWFVRGMTCLSTGFDTSIDQKVSQQPSQKMTRVQAENYDSKGPPTIFTVVITWDPFWVIKQCKLMVFFEGFPL